MASEGPRLRPTIMGTSGFHSSSSALLCSAFKNVRRFARRRHNLSNQSCQRFSNRLVMRVLHETSAAAITAASLVRLLAAGPSTVFSAEVRPWRRPPRSDQHVRIRLQNDGNEDINVVSNPSAQNATPCQTPCRSREHFPPR